MTLIISKIQNATCDYFGVQNDSFVLFFKDLYMNYW